MDGVDREYEGRLQVVRLDFNDRANGDAIDALGVSVHPTIVLLHADGQVEATLFGPQTGEQLRARVEALLAEGRSP